MKGIPFLKHVVIKEMGKQWMHSFSAGLNGSAVGPLQGYSSIGQLITSGELRL